MHKPSVLLSLFAWLVILSSPVLLYLKIADNEHKIPDPFKDGIITGGRIESKKDSTVKKADGKIISFIYVSYRTTYSSKINTVSKRDSFFNNSVAAMRRMLVAENFKVNIPGLKFTELAVEKNRYDLLREGDSLKIIYSAVDPDQAMLQEDKKVETRSNANSAWTGGCIVAFMFGIWILVMNKRRRAQGQESDPLSSLNVYSSIKKEEPPKTGGRPE